MILNACNNELFDPGRDQQRSTRYSFNVLHGIRSTFYTVFVQRSTRYLFNVLHGIRSSNEKLEYNNSNKSNVSMLCWFICCSISIAMCCMYTCIIYLLCISIFHSSEIKV